MDQQPSLAAKLLAEFVGTFFLIAAGVGIFASDVVADSGAGLLAVAFAHGLAIAIGVTAVAHISGGHLNPAVTVAMLVFRKQKPSEGGLYIVAQLFGAFCAALALKIGFDVSAEALTGSVPALGPRLDIANGLLLEAIATFLLVWTIFGVAVDKRGALSSVSGLPIGFAVTVGILMIGPFTGAALNPARWFGPALLTGTWTDAIVWIAGPMIGAILAGAAYLFIVNPDAGSAATD